MEMTWEPPRPAKPFRPANRAIESQGPFADETHYTQVYTGELGTKRQPFKQPQSSKVHSGKLSDVTSNRADFPHFADAEVRQPFKPQRVLEDFKEERNFQTENGLQFNEKGYQVRQPHIPSTNILSAGKFEGGTTSAADFGWKTQDSPAQKKLTHNIDGYVPPSKVDNRDFKTVNAVTFTGETVKPRSIFRPTSTVHNNAKFEGVPVSKTDYQYYEGARPSTPVIPIRSELGDKNAKFEDTTSYGTNYTDQPRSKRGAFIPKSSAFASNAKFEGTTSNRSDFPHWKDSRPQPIARPVREFEGEEKEERTFQTENSNQFNDKGYQVRMTRKPVHQPMDTKSFQGQTSNKSDFQHWGSQPTRKYITQKGEIEIDNTDARDFVSTNMSTFTGEYAAPLATLRPRNTVEFSKQSTEGPSITHRDFVNHWVHPDKR